VKRSTKIVCTLGPAVDSKEKIAALIEAGMNVARLNCSHGDWETKVKWIEWIRELQSDIAPVAILADLQGPKFRVGELEGGQIDLTVGQTVSVGKGEGVDIPINQDEILKVMGPQGRLLLGDGEIELRIVSGQAGSFKAKVVTGGLLRSRKGVTLVGKVFDVPALTPKDIEDVLEAVKQRVDFIALSYVKSASDIRELRRTVDRLDKSIHLCAKIETREAIKDLDNILKAVDLVMVARGDMGLQMDIEDVPLMQKRIIGMGAAAGKPVITATQMLESMIENPRPTRAETTDIANAILDGTDAVMLSAETASGKYPFECVKTMVRIAEKTEAAYANFHMSREGDHSRQTMSHTDAIAHAVCDLAVLVRPKAILTLTTSGQTSRLVSKFRPKAPILCATANARTQAQMAVVWGVEALRVPEPTTTDENIQHAIDAFFKHRRLKCDDLVIITAGVPAGVPGNTNLIQTQVVK
jgi:pyruvate kinase